MKKQLIALGAVGVLSIGLGIKAFAQQGGSAQAQESAHEKVQTVAYDVACDARTFKLNKSGTLLDARRGDGFIVEGKIYPAGTIQPGGTPENPGPFDPDTAPGSIGTWICRGTFTADISDILAGAHPHLYSTQIHLFKTGDAFVHEGPEGGAPQMRALTGGIGALMGASGEVLEVPLGVNRTGLFNIRHTFRVKASSLK